MNGREGGENRKLTRHMWTTRTAAGVVDSNVSSSSSFLKDGRKISVGECALFKLAEDSPPLVGIIRCYTFEKEGNLKLRVNWLYRPAEVKLLKGAALEAAPNEVFYSFHSDEIPAASLLHPCKVAFLPKGAELPPGFSSFVCWRVYDITNKCLWWLTDQDYMDDRQEEVDKLLHKTCIEMHASAEQQQGPRSPKTVNGSAATSPLKESQDSVQNSSSNLSSHRKGKKRERGDQSIDTIKRERSSRPDDGDSGQLRSESILNSEIAKFSAKGGLTDSEAVVRLVQLMQPGKSEKKIDLTERSMLASIIAATNKLEFLNQLVQLRGLHVLNEWLQEVRKGKIGEAGNLKNGDKSVDDFLLVLLRALDKIPVNLNALQMCNIGKSVNHLRSHKNSEIQKKARSLVDTWKKRVEVEMSINDTKSGSSQAVQWPGRLQHDSSHGGNRHSSGSDAAIRTSITHHSSLKSAQLKPVSGDANSKSASAHSGGSRSTLSPTSTTNHCKDGQLRVSANGGSSEPLKVAREKKSCSSSQSHTNSQCSSDQAKNMVPCGKEDTSSTAGSRSLCQTVGNSSKQHKSANCPASGINKETASNRSSCMVRNLAEVKVSHNAVDASVQESNNHKLIVKIPNQGRGSAQSISGGGLENSSCRDSRASSALSEKHDQFDASMRGTKNDSHHFHEVDGSSTSVHQRTSETRGLSNVSKKSCLPSRNEIKSRKAHDSSFCPMNALIESCAKFSEANVSVSAGSDVGMSLLSNVSASELSKSNIVSPAVSPSRHSKSVETSSRNHVGNEKQLHGDDVVQHCQPTEVADTDNPVNVVGVLNAKGDSSKCSGTKTESLHQSGEYCLKNNGNLNDNMGTASPPVSMECTIRGSIANFCAETINGKVTAAKEENKIEISVASQEHGGSLEAEDSVKDAVLNDELERNAHRGNGFCPISNDVDEKSNVSKGLDSNIALEQNSLAVDLQSDPMKVNEEPVMVSPGASQHLAAVVSNEVKSEKTEGVTLCDVGGQVGNKILSKENDLASVSEKQGEPRVSCADVDSDRICRDQTLEIKEVPVQQSANLSTQVNCSAVALLERELHSTGEGTKSIAVEEEREENVGSAIINVALSPALGGLHVDTKLGFDLNEGFNVDEGKNVESVSMAAGPCPDNVCSVSPLQVPVSSASCALPASVTLAAAAKGPFVPPDDLLWNKRELGWKGSAATSAFRPAEPRKVMEVPLGLGKVPVLDAPACRSGRFPLDIDLNVADESSGQEFDVRGNPVCELMTTSSVRSSVGLDLDLNKVDEVPDMAHMGGHTFSNIQRVEVLTHHVNPSTSSAVFNGGASDKRDFDLNDGPETEEFPVEHIPYSQHTCGNIPLQASLGPRNISTDTGNCFSWYPPSALPDREAFSIVGLGGPQRVLGGPTAALSFNPDAYWGSVLSSSPALPFHPAPFQYPVLPFGTSFPLPTSALAGGSSGYLDSTSGGRVSTIPSQLVGNAAAVSFQYPHAYVFSRSIPDVGNNGVIESNHKWGKQGLDLNSGPILDVEGRDESLPIVSRQVSAISSQSFAEEQARIYSMGGGHQKRKEPEGSWNIDELNFKQSSW